MRGHFKVVVDRDADTCKITKEITGKPPRGPYYGTPFGIMDLGVFPGTVQAEQVVETLPLKQARALLLALKEVEPELEFRKIVTATKLF